MNNKFTRAGMAHLNPFSKKIVKKAEKKVVTRLQDWPDMDMSIRHNNWKNVETPNPCAETPLEVNPFSDRLAHQLRQQATITPADIQQLKVRMDAEFSRQVAFGSTWVSGSMRYQREEPIPDPVEGEEGFKAPSIIMTKNPVGYKHEKGFTGHHQHVEYKYDRGSSTKSGHAGTLSISDSIGGCGMQQLYGWTNISTPEIADMLVKEMLSDIHKATGLIICQVGKSYYHTPIVKALVDNGFTTTHEYINYTHGMDGKYTQRVYSYIPPDKSEYEDEDCDEEDYDEDEEDEDPEDVGF